MIPIDFGYPSFYLLSTVDSKLDSSWYYTELLRFHCQFSHFGCYIKNPFMRDNQEITIRVIESLVSHWSICRIVINSNSLFKWWLSCSCYSDQTLNKISFLSLLYRRYRLPSQLIWVKFNMFTAIKVSHNFKFSFWRRILALYSWRSYLIQPSFLIFASFDSKSSSRQLLCVYAIF